MVSTLSSSLNVFFFLKKILQGVYSAIGLTLVVERFLQSTTMVFFYFMLRFFLPVIEKYNFLAFFKLMFPMTTGNGVSIQKYFDGKPRRKVWSVGCSEIFFVYISNSEYYYLEYECSEILSVASLLRDVFLKTFRMLHLQSNVLNTIFF